MVILPGSPTYGRGAAATASSSEFLVLERECIVALDRGQLALTARLSGGITLGDEFVQPEATTALVEVSSVSVGAMLPMLDTAASDGCCSGPCMQSML
jgi:hypothetical protein